jgi:hypothetical protein
MSELLVISKRDLEDTLRKFLSVQREDVRKKICGLQHVLYVLDMSERAFYDHIKDPKCLIRPSAKRGKYVLKSVEEEADRLNGEK